MEILGHARYAVKIAQGAHLAPPYDRGRLRRFVWGFALPFGIVRATFRDRGARMQWLEWSSIQLTVLILLGVRIGFMESDLGDRKHLSFGDLVAFASASYAALTVVEWILIALSREFHDVLSYRAAMATGVVAEPLAGPPRIRLDFRWLWNKGKRRLRALLLLGTAMPFLVFTLGIPHIGDAVYLALMTAWTAYWLAVFAVGGSFLAWEDAPQPHGPWFVRAFATVGRVPVLGIPPRIYARFLAWATRSVSPVCAAFERDPWTAAGLALARTLAGVPGVYLFLRPAFSVAATHAILVQRASLPPPDSGFGAGGPRVA